MSILDCETCREHMVDVFAREADPATLQAFEAHLEECPTCASLWQDYQELRASVDGWANAQEPQPETVEAILEAADRRLQRGAKISLHPWWKVLLSPPALAAATLLVVAGLGIYSQRWLGEHAPSDGQNATVATLREVQESGEKIPPAPEKPPLDLVRQELEEKARERGKADRDGRKQAPYGAAPLVKERNTAMEPGFFAQQAQRNEAPAPAGEEEQHSLARATTRGLDSASAPRTTVAVGTSSQDEQKSQMQAPPQAAFGGNSSVDKEAAGDDLKAKPSAEEWVASAKKKMKKKDYAGALQDLKKAQSLQDSEAIRKLIRECQKKQGQAPPP